MAQALSENKHQHSMRRVLVWQFLFVCLLRFSYKYQIFLYAKPFTLVGRHGIMVFRPENLNGVALSSAEASLYCGEAFVLRLGRKKKRDY